MQWRRGLFRIWIGLSVLWTIVGLSALYSRHKDWGEFYRLWGKELPLDWWASELKMVFLPWILTAIAFGVRWIIRGFRIVPKKPGDHLGILFASLLIITIAGAAQAQSSTRSFYDGRGSFAGSSVTRGNSSSFYDGQGRFSGSSINTGSQR